MEEKKEKEACEDFSFLVLAAVVIGIIFMVFGNLFINPIVRLLGATDVLMDYCVGYLSVCLFLAPACILQLVFQTFFVTAGKPVLGLALTISGGIANMILDYVFMGVFHMGVEGAALATGIGQLIPALAGIIYFLFVRHSLYLVKPKIRWSVLAESSFNGSSEMVTNLSGAIVTFLYNIMMLKLVGEAGVAAITIVLYGQFLFNALYMGFSMGVAPVISYNYGSGNQRLLKRIFKICVGFIAISSIIVTVFALVMSPVIVEIFTPVGTETYALAKTGFFLFSLNFVFAGINIFSSSMFTAFSDGKTSAIISFVRTFVLIVINILVLPTLIGVNGVWLSVPLAEFMSVFLSGYFFIRKKGKYNYM